ncbi:hypothetical protein I546_1880 [Mycobacterium kansasii 732]|nr:hypothetical protein I546_1880 [Mycobacterium kansasii 732]
MRHEHAPQHLPSTDPPQTQSPHAHQSPAAQASPPAPHPSHSTPVPPVPRRLLRHPGLATAVSTCWASARQG